MFPTQNGQMKKTTEFRPRALGEIAIRCADIKVMAEFYRDVIGLEVLSGSHRDGIIFFKIGDGFQGHTSVLALFRHDAGRPELHPQGDLAPQTGAGSSLHHLALSLPSTELPAVEKWYKKINQPYRFETFGWIGWRGIFTQDPEGNTIELVAYDAAFKA